MNNAEDPAAAFTRAQQALARGDGNGAVAELNRALAANPDHEEALHLMAQLAHQTGRADLALGYLDRLCVLLPENAGYWFSLGAILIEVGEAEAGERAWSRVIDLEPDHEGARINLGNRRKLQGRLEEAAEHYRTVVAGAPDHVEGLSNLASVLTSQGLHHEAANLYERIAVLRPDLHMAQSNRLMNMNYMADMDAGTIADAHRAWGGQFPDPVPVETGRDPERRLRIGYLSPDLCSHPVFWFFHALISHHDRDRFEICCFSNLRQGDEKTAVIRGLSDRWHEVAELDDAALDGLIRAEGIDILVDMAGHTANNRLPVMAMRPAPVQMTWLGYPNTTGLRTVDYRIVDQWTDPEGSGKLHTEKLLRLPGGFLCYSPPNDGPDVGPLPARQSGAVTFGSFNNLAKVTADVIACWAGILKQVPGSRLMMKARSLDDPGTRARYLDWFAQEGIGPGRLILKGRLAGNWDHLDLYNQVDIALDSFPYNGTTTTCEALWMGVPVLALAGNHHASRVSASLLRSVGLPEFIAETEQDMAARAYSLTQNINNLSQVREKLRGKMLSSPLCDAVRFAAEMEQGLRDAWRYHCA